MPPSEAPTTAGQRTIPFSTYRLQLHPGFRFEEARSIISYLDALGAGACYISPCLAARPGSTHGYDIVDHSRINPALGGEEAFAGFSDELRRRGMGLILDFVPNHMGIDPVANPWWRDVLENGECSRAARFFDIDWKPLKPELHGKVLLPILGDHYGEVLDEGQLQLAFQDGELTLNYHGLSLPVNPRQAPLVYEHGIDALREQLGEDDPALREFLSILFTLSRLPAHTETAPDLIEARRREKTLAHERLAALVNNSAAVREHIENQIKRFNGEPGRPESFDLLHDLIERQPYRPAYWRTALEEINYRRFFDINDLAALRMEDPAVFQEAHQLVLRLIAEDRITGLRLDHVDGLFHPRAYFATLQQAAQGAADAVESEPRPLYVVVEKILAPSEPLPPDWLVDGTTGYDFLNEVNGIFIDSRNERAIRNIYTSFVGGNSLISDVIYESKRLIMTTAMSGELNLLAHELNRISESDRRTRDFTLESLRRALREVVACYGAYRTYVGPSGFTEADAHAVDIALQRAIRRNPAMETSIFEFLRGALLPDRAALPEEAYQRRLRFAMKVQQYTAPVHAKGLEDTAFYRYIPLLSINEVGGELYRFGRSVEELHAGNRERQRHWAGGLLSTASHDTKRGEDARARLNVLSEVPDRWRMRVEGWARLNEGLRGSVDGEPAPDRHDEYLLYQTLAGVWPASGPSQPSSKLVERVQEYISKAMKEAKRRTSWIHPNEPYDQAVAEFIEAVLEGPGAARFLESFLRFQRRVARWGMINSLAQTVLKLVSPGVPDFYQGVELWDLSLVDPDNRRPVDFDQRRQWLEKIDARVPPLEALEEKDPPPREAPWKVAADMLRGWRDGRIKLFVTSRGLRLRRRHPELFLKGQYHALESLGERRDHVVALAREWEGKAVLAVVPRLAATLCGFEGPLPLGAKVWGESRTLLPAEWPDRPYFHLFTGEQIATGTDGGQKFLATADVFQSFPVAILISG